MGTLPGLQCVGYGLQCKAEGQETLTVRSPTSAGQPRHIIIIIKGHSLRRACLQTATNTGTGILLGGAPAQTWCTRRQPGL